MLLTLLSPQAAAGTIVGTDTYDVLLLQSHLSTIAQELVVLV